MPYVIGQPQETPLTEVEREKRVKELQAEQARTLREGLGAVTTTPDQDKQTNAEYRASRGFTSGGMKKRKEG